jgi:gentisate 1,2-dioxygenase
MIFMKSYLVIILAGFLIYELGFAKTPMKCNEDYLHGNSIDPAISNDYGVFPQDDCFYHKAINTGDIEYCDQIDDPIVNSTCIKDMAIKKKDPTICSKGKKIDLTKRPDFKYSMKVYHDTCILKYAYEYSDPSVCKMIQHGNSIDPECLNSAGLKKKSAP